MVLNQLFMKSKWLLVFIIPVFVASCGEANNENISESAGLSAVNLPHLEVYKRASCGCCRKWITHVKENGFQTKAQNSTNLTSWKIKKGIKKQYHSCHTAVAEGGYVFEGHIPAKYIHQFLANVPENSIGLAVPAMPIGSPGMEVGRKFSPYQVLLLKGDGTYEIYAKVSNYEEQF